MTTQNRESEWSYYDAVKDWRERIPKEKFSSYHLEVSTHKQFGEVLQSQIDSTRDLIFAFLKEAAPDITGFVKKDSSSPRKFIVVKVKTARLKLDDICQARKYAQLFNAGYALL